MAVVLMAAVGMAALRNANAWWAGAMLMLALASVGGAVLGIIIMRGRERYWWLGFGMFCGGYLILTFAAGLHHRGDATSADHPIPRLHPFGVRGFSQLCTAPPDPLVAT